LFIKRKKNEINFTRRDEMPKIWSFTKCWVGESGKAILNLNNSVNNFTFIFRF